MLYPDLTYSYSSNLTDTQDVELPPMTEGTRICLYIVLLVDKFHYWLAGSKNTAYVIKSSFVVQDKLNFHENSCFVC